MEKRIPLNSLENGQRGLVFDIHECTFRPRLIEMGIIKGTELTVLHRSILNGPLAIKVGTHTLALRLDECNYIIVEILNES